MPKLSELIAKAKAKADELDKSEAEHQPRDHGVKCVMCNRRETFNHSAICDGCREA